MGGYRPMKEITVGIIGDGSDENPYRPDYDKEWRSPRYNHDEELVVVVVPDTS